MHHVSRHQSSSSTKFMCLRKRNNIILPGGIKNEIQCFNLQKAKSVIIKTNGCFSPLYTHVPFVCQVTCLPNACVCMCLISGHCFCCSSCTMFKVVEATVNNNMYIVQSIHVRMVLISWLALGYTRSS